MKYYLVALLFCCHLVCRVDANEFATSIRPILSNHCFQCHGPDEETRAADLRLDTQDGVEYAFAEGEIEASEAWRRIVSDDPDEQMPPPEFEKPLSLEQREQLKEWMASGGQWSQHWAFTKPQRPALPEVDEADHPIDRFIVDRLHREGLKLSPEASRETLIRRLKLDLLGLPPTLAEIDEFVSDKAPDAYERLVDRLLASPHFGERMAVEWLDGSRYADTNGYQNDFKRSMWPWRDWVISAFNENMPFDQFVIEQIAGDLLPNPTVQQRIATGFNRNHRTVTEAGSISEEWLVENVVDRVETTSTVFLGLTMGCARCHDHKYDPISQREFYQFFSFFHSIKEQGVFQEQRGNTDPLLPVLPPAELERLDALKATENELTLSWERMNSEIVERSRDWSEEDMPTASATELPACAFQLVLGGQLNAQLADGTSVAPSKKTGKIIWNAGPFGTAAKFSGQHSLEYERGIAPDIDQPFTISFWVKPEADGAILDKIDLENLSRGYDIYWKQPGRLEVHMIHSWPADALKVSTEEDGAVPPNRWSHITLVYDGSAKAQGITLRVNGEQVPLKVEADKLKNSFAAEVPFRLACRSRGFSLFATVTDLRYYEAALDQSQVDKVITQSLMRMFEQQEALADESFQQTRGQLYGNFSQSDFATEYRRVRRELLAKQEEIKAVIASNPTVMVMEELPTPRETFVLNRGEYDKPDKEQPVSPSIPEFLGKLPENVEQNRLALATWLVSADNPLTSRVRVNRIWQMLFGTGIVKTSENFGVQADLPSHPQLLDWMATEFIQSGWDTKQLLRMIVTSRTYRQESSAVADLIAKDPENRLLARGPRFRLSAEVIRDNALAASGLLTTKIGGESIRPYQPEGLWDELAGGAGEGPYVQSHGDDLYRRSLYIYRKRTVPHPTTNTFDAPSFEICQVARARTNTPLQALALLNDVTYVEAARKLAERMLVEGGNDDAARLNHGFRLVAGRAATPKELDILQRGCERKRALFAEDPNAAEQFLSHGESKIAAATPAAELAAYTAVASVLLNLDETITKE